MSDGLNDIFKNPKHRLYKMIVDGLFEIKSFKDIEKMQKIKRRAKMVCSDHDFIVNNQADRIEKLERLVRSVRIVDDEYRPRIKLDDIYNKHWLEYRDEVLK